MANTQRFCVLLFLFAASITIASAWDERKTIPANIPATKGTIRTNFLITASGETENGLFSFSVRNNVGKFTVRGQEYIAVGYYTQGTLPIGTDGARWVDFIGISTKQDNMAWIVFQCEPIVNATTIEAVYEEDYSHEGVADPCNAACHFTDLSGKPDAIIPVSLPPVKKVPLAGTVDSNVTILGDNVYLNRADSGWVVIDGKRYITVPINNIPCPNCGGDCETCYRSPWYEAHVVFYDEEATELGFGIFYMYPYNRTFVQFNYTLMLPSLKTPAITFKAHWYGEPMGGNYELEPYYSENRPDLPREQQQQQQQRYLNMKKKSGRPPVGKSVFSWHQLFTDSDKRGGDDVFAS